MADPAEFDLVQAQLPPVVASCRKNIDLLNVFEDADCAEDGLELQVIPAIAIPAPYHELLVHERDMTSTLAQFHGEPIGLQVLQQQVVDGEVVRHVVLHGQRTGRALEYGASRIRLASLAPQARADVLNGSTPFGGILNALGLQYRSCPGGFIKIRPHSRVAAALQYQDGPRPQWLYGRCNCLSHADVGTMAEVVEILPPADQPE